MGLPKYAREHKDRAGLSSSRNKTEEEPSFSILFFMKGAASSQCLWGEGQGRRHPLSSEKHWESSAFIHASGQGLRTALGLTLVGTCVDPKR